MNCRWGSISSGIVTDNVRTKVVPLFLSSNSVKLALSRAFAFDTGTLMRNMSPDGEITSGCRLCCASHSVIALTLSGLGATNASTYKVKSESKPQGSDYVRTSDFDKCFP